MKPLRMFSFTLVALAFAAAAVHAQAGGDYAIVRHAHTGGGLVGAAGGDYVLGGSIGQPDAGELAGGDFVLTGGFWGRGVPPTTGAGPGRVLPPPERRRVHRDPPRRPLRLTPTPIRRPSS